MPNLIPEHPDAFGRIRKGSGHHEWASRDYLDIDCAATGCKWNVGAKCAVPSRCKIKPDGGCAGFEAKDGD